MDSRFPGRRWFDCITIRVSDAPSKGTVTSGRHTSVFYTVTISHKVTGATTTILKSDFDFEVLRDQAQNALDHGHVCRAACPWYYVDVSEHVPKRRVLTVLETTKRSIAAHIRMYQDLFDHTVAFILSPESHACPKAEVAIPRLFFDFLGQGMDGASDLLVVSPPDGSSSKALSRHGSYRTESQHQAKLSTSYCGVCGLMLTPDASTAPLTVQLDTVALTTLTCGHVFHDECILEVLNVNLECPSCNPTYEAANVDN
ncbi:hypothetical protein H310_11283 [Aphanomyces invadans]|uniref:RING-type domain-containing protein n=1 Tax=Aphanomyces invadans TaxID=157072 RepID=A0A024TN40_9STRA|nr:hypothetical protein H310_11283 [Aphanomyces invadans]ETV95408.1 hypothetical protein H310_11283 [Aphanomyces invadans]|eukprot:XP_008876109.1 hypothetical protein H310_11283 [Aphanomyces invadans]